MLEPLDHATDHASDRATAARQPQDARREQLIEATIRTIADHGLSNVTLNKVASLAGLTAGMVNFHFDSKRELLRATLERVANEFTTVCRAAVAGAGSDPVTALRALVEASLGKKLAAPEKLAVWYAFWGESQARDDYMDICGASDQGFYDMVHGQIAELAAKSPAGLDTRAAALGLCGLLDALCQEALVRREEFNRGDAIETCRRYMANMFGAALVPPPAPRVKADAVPTLPLTLPAWAYTSEEFHRLEVEKIHRPAWHLVCHVNEMKSLGDYVTFEAFGERAFVIRGKDGVIRAFHNVCRHRAHAVVGGRSGTCKGVIRCPYHAWTYDFLGSLKGVAAARTFPDFEREKFGLHPLECEVFQGFVYLRFRPGGPSVAERYAPYADELAAHRLEEMEPIADYWGGDMDADWKNVWDNYLEDYHFPGGHPGLSGLMSPSYERQPNDATRTVRLSHPMRAKAKGGWGARMYSSILPDYDHLPPALRRRWSYFFLYPAVSFEIYPDMIDFFHVVPIGPGRVRLRWRAYGLPNPSRAMRAARWLNMRVNYQVHDEDLNLIASVQRGLAGSSYSTGLLGDKEVAVKAVQSWVRADVPEAAQAHPMG